jgi:outer membrane protein assembly factor BamD (BamD/ComL family)
MLPALQPEAEEISGQTAVVTNLYCQQKKLDSSNAVLATNLLALAKLYQNELEDYQAAITTYEDYLQRYPDKLADGEVYLGLYYCYNKLGNTERANYYKNLLNTKFANSKSWQLLNNPAALDPKIQNPQATKLYENIYNLFIEGRFEEAITEKKKADALYGINYWTPQLLYIEALYNVRQRNDSIAIAGLNALIQNNPNSPLRNKAETMIDVLQRRKEIETYLTNLQVTRAEDDTKLIAIEDNKPIVKAPPVAPAAPAKQLVLTAPAVNVKDTVKAVPLLAKGSFVMKTAAPHTVIMILDKVDGVYVNEAKNALSRYNKENYYGQVIDITKDALDAGLNLLVMSSFADGAAALEYYTKLKKDAPIELSWLPANKYSFLIITNENLQVLKENKDITGYKTLLNTIYPGKF